jgi:ABC-type multidrug transport system fused ATPase/permease subunit
MIFLTHKVSISVQGIATFFSGFTIAFIRSWRLTIILFCILPSMLLVFGIAGAMVAKLALKIVAEYSSAATIAEEVLSSIRTAQAFGTEEKLAKLYDQNLDSAQKVGYKKALVLACMFAAVFCLVYLAYGLGFCILSTILGLIFRGGFTDHCKRRNNRRCGHKCVICCYYIYLCTQPSCSANREFLESCCCSAKDFPDD